MIDAFMIHVLYSDGGPPETGRQEVDQLAARWLDICSDLLEKHGPVLDHNMGSTLAHIDVKMGGPIGQLSVYGDPCFDFAISRGNTSEQDCAAVGHFRNLVEQLVAGAGSTVSTEVTSVLDEAPGTACLLLLDRPDPSIDDDRKAALMQLGLHLAGAYYRYCDSGDDKN